MIEESDGNLPALTGRIDNENQVELLPPNDTESSSFSARIISQITDDFTEEDEQEIDLKLDDDIYY